MIDTGAHCTRGFEGKVVMVTGAGSGIGRAAALGFAERGALVYAVGRSIAPVEETVALIRHEGGQAHAAQADVAQEEQVRALVSRIGRETGKLHVAFNNAGIAGEAHRIETYPTSDFEHVLRTNLLSVFLCLKNQLPLMHRSGGGAICNNASVAALTGPGGMCAYAASKHGVHGLTRVAAMENAARGIRVNTLAPGWTETPMVQQASAQNPAFSKQVLTAIPAQRGASPQEVAAAAIWLCSHQASYVYGQMLVVDGGMTIGGFAPTDG